MKTTATDIFQKLQDEGIIDSQGVIQFSFAGIDVQIEKKDVIGNIIEEWVKKWLEAHGIDFIHNESQNPPDFYLDPDDKTKNLLEVKVFDYDASPGFDIADFPNAYHLFENEVTLPLHTRLTDEDVEYVIGNYVEVVKEL